MIIRCEKCDTKYRLDASMISTAAVKVQCSKCAHIFIVPASADNNMSTDLPADLPSSASSEENHDAGAENDYRGGAEVKAEPGDEEKAETEPEPEEEAETGTEEPTPNIESPTEPSQGFEMTFGAPPEGAVDNPEEDKDLTKESTPGEPEEYVDNVAAFNELDSEIEPEPSKSPDIAFSAPDETALEVASTEEEAKEEDAEEDAEEASDDTKATVEGNGNSFEPYSYDEPETSLNEAEVTRGDGEGAAKDFDLSFNTPDTLPEGDGEAKEEFIVYEAAADETSEPMAKYYVDKNSPSSEPAEDLELRERLKKSKTDEETSAGVSIEKPSFNEELLKAESAEEKAPTPQTQTPPPSEPTFTVPQKPTKEGVKKSGGLRALVVIVIILILAGGILYIKTRPQNNTLMALPTKAQTIEIESTKGYYVLNKDSGRIFVIESVIKNISEGPVKISGIRGVVLDSSGKEMASKLVAPGRIVTAKDLRTLPVDRLLRSFRDTSEGTIPKKAIIPTMVLFPDLNDAVAEYGIDVLR